MGKSISWIASAVVVSVAALTALALDRHVGMISQARADGLNEGGSDALCPRGNATVHGIYMSKGGGTVVGVGAVAFIGTVHVDGQGGVSNPFTISFAGTISRAVVPGTYTVTSDCSGTLSLGGGANNFDMRVSPDGSKIDYIQTDAGTVISGSATRVSF